MTDVRVTMRDGYMAIEVDGHADYAPHGQDIVCAGISAIIQTCALGLQAIAETYPDHVRITVNQTTKK